MFVPKEEEETWQPSLHLVTLSLTIIFPISPLIQRNRATSLNAAQSTQIKDEERSRSLDEMRLINYNDLQINQ